MVLLLMTDIIVHGMHMTLANTERTIAVLPCEMAIGIPILVDPMRTVGFQGTYHLSQGPVLRQCKQEMYVIGGTSDADGLTIARLQDTSKIGIHLCKKCMRQQIYPVLGREDQMDIVSCQRLRHDDVYFSGTCLSPFFASMILAIMMKR